MLFLLIYWVLTAGCSSKKKICQNCKKTTTTKTNLVKWEAVYARFSIHPSASTALPGFWRLSQLSYGNKKKQWPVFKMTTYVRNLFIYNSLNIPSHHFSHFEVWTESLCLRFGIIVLLHDLFPPRAYIWL